MHSQDIEQAYREGTYTESSPGGADAEYKVEELRKLLARTAFPLPPLARVADIGCGSGRSTGLLRHMLGRGGELSCQVTGYDLHPGVESLPAGPGVRFVHGDFREGADRFDLAVLFDVVEHVLAPMDFLRAVAERADYLAMHIPLDASFMVLTRQLNRENLAYPGHVLVLDIPSAINLVTFAGLRPLDYRLSPAFRAPSCRSSWSQILLYPLRSLIWAISPYLLQRTLGGVSLTLLARSPRPSP